MIYSILVLCLLICALEYLLWKLFQKKLSGLSFPHEFDESFFRFLTPVRLRVTAISHMIFLCAVIILSCIFLW